MPEAKSRSVMFSGTPSGDGDGSLIVDRETFETVAGRAPAGDEVIGRGKYRLFLEDWAALFRSKRKVVVKISVQPL